MQSLDNNPAARVAYDFRILFLL